MLTACLHYLVTSGDNKKNTNEERKNFFSQCLPKQCSTRCIFWIFNGREFCLTHCSLKVHWFMPADYNTHIYMLTPYNINEFTKVECDKHSQVRRTLTAFWEESKLGRGDWNKMRRFEQSKVRIFTKFLFSTQTWNMERYTKTTWTCFEKLLCFYLNAVT